VIREIERLRPAAKGQLELIGSHSWGADPYAAGAWVYFRPGEVTRFAGIIGRPHGRLHFCGEHLAVANRGMEGAMESGERAAAEILTGAA
jgi:monoamine oxidase